MCPDMYRNILTLPRPFIFVPQGIPVNGRRKKSSSPSKSSSGVGKIRYWERWGGKIQQVLYQCNDLVLLLWHCFSWRHCICTYYYSTACFIFPANKNNTFGRNNLILKTWFMPSYFHHNVNDLRVPSHCYASIKRLSMFSFSQIWNDETSRKFIPSLKSYCLNSYPQKYYILRQCDEKKSKKPSFFNKR